MALDIVPTQATGPVRQLGLALSGGGSRAAAFHRGTVSALIELGLVDAIDVVSTVSGGSVFGGSWMASRKGTSDQAFLDSMRAELQKGFVRRSIGWRLIPALLPFVPYSRADVIAATFDRIFFGGMTLSELPERPLLCVNASVMNTNQVGKFSRDGFSCYRLFEKIGAPPQSANFVSLPDYPVARAVMASAAFPIGVPPIILKASALPREYTFSSALGRPREIALTDGGVIENLGIQTLLKSERFGTWNMVVSDAGTHQNPWNPSSPVNPLATIGAALVTLASLTRVMLMMNDKQNAWARQQIIEDVHASWLADELRSTKRRRSLNLLLSQIAQGPRREVLFVRINQDWDRFLSSIPPYRLFELAERSGDRDLPPRDKPREIEAFLEATGVKLARARDLYAQLGGADGVEACNAVGTNFTAIDGGMLDKLASHAAWQMHLAHGVYGLTVLKSSSAAA